MELPTLDAVSIESSCKKLASIYSTDVNELELVTECQHFKHHQPANLSVSALYRSIKSDYLESTFPNIEIALRIYLTLMPTNCTGERSFSKLKIIKNYLRTTMLEPRLTAISIMSIESDMLDEIDLAEIISTFAAAKSRKRFSSIGA
jgi:hAT family C-terminal dimerisation region